MDKIIRLGVDLAKEKIQVYAENRLEKEIFNKQMSRSKFLNFMSKTGICKVSMEACSNANYYARKFRELGHEVFLIAPQYVKPYVKRNKNDKNDAEAIATASKQKNMYFVKPKEIWQQDIQSLHRVRERLIKNKTALTNELRSILSERGIFINKGAKALSKVLLEIDIKKGDYTEISDIIYNLTKELLVEYREINLRINKIEEQLKTISNDNDISKKIESVPGIGLITATALLSVIGNNASQFKNGRQFSAYIGLVPRQHSSGGKSKLLGISKQGNTYLRRLLVHGARSVVRVSDYKMDELSRWVTNKKKTRGWNRACIALANKNARIVLALMKNDTDYKINYNTCIKEAS